MNVNVYLSIINEWRYFCVEKHKRISEESQQLTVNGVFPWSSLSPKSLKALKSFRKIDHGRRARGFISWLDGNATPLFVFPRKEPLAVRSAVNRFSTSIPP